ncbi:MAG: hypothetical protein HZC54_13505 [Verrucomicrobia bacterium]|nr:hypothetical protein [Verrucomicrobiota bacterium]
MNAKQELAMLKEMEGIYQNCPERVATYTRWKRIAFAGGWILIFVAGVLSGAKILNSTSCGAIGVLGGFVMGISLMFSVSAKQMPLFVRYTTLRDEEIQNRIEELKGT